eukprot:gene15505-biopygen15738
MAEQNQPPEQGTRPPSSLPGHRRGRGLDRWSKGPDRRSSCVDRRSRPPEQESRAPEQVVPPDPLPRRSGSLRRSRALLLLSDPYSSGDLDLLLRRSGPVAAQTVRSCAGGVALSPMLAGSAGLDSLFRHGPAAPGQKVFHRPVTGRKVFHNRPANSSH